MRKFKFVLLCLFAATLLLPSFASADALDDIVARGTLRVGMEPGYMPFEMTNQKGEIIGFDVDIAKRMAKAMGVKLELVSTAWDGIIPGLITDKYDIIMSGMTLTQERNLKVAFASPYIVVGQSILVKKRICQRGQDLSRPQRSKVQGCVQAGNHWRAGHQTHDPESKLYLL